VEIPRPFAIVVLIDHRHDYDYDNDNDRTGHGLDRPAVLR